MDFLLTCKPASHPWIAEQVEYGEPETLEERKWNGRRHIVHKYEWVNGIENRADGEKLLANYLSFEMYDEGKKEVVYRNSWLTSHRIDRGNVRNMVECGRARWKIENEHNNVLKNHGYHLEHNFGHGKNHANEVFCLLNLLAFLYHGIQALDDADYQKARASFGRKDDFYWGLRYETSRYLHETWHSLFLTVSGSAPDG